MSHRPASAEPSELELPDLAAFDSRSTRRAIRRGLVRTALYAVLLLLVGWLVLALVSAHVAEVGGPRSHFVYVMDGAVQLANLDYAISNLGSATSGLTANLTYTATLQPRAVGLGPAPTTVQTHRNVLGHLDLRFRRPPQTPLYQTLVSPPPNKDATRAVLANLPGALTATVVVRFAKPLDSVGFTRFAQAHGLALVAMPIPHHVPSEPTALIVSPPTRAGDQTQVLVWPNSSLLQFRAWASALRSRDDQNLRALSLPKSSVFQRLAARPKVYSLVLNSVPVGSPPGTSQVRSVPGLLDDPAVVGVSLASAAFDLAPK